MRSTKVLPTTRICKFGSSKRSVTWRQNWFLLPLLLSWMCILGGVSSQNIVVSLQKYPKFFACKFPWHISKISEIQQEQLEMLDSFPQSTCSLLASRWALLNPKMMIPACVKATTRQKKKEPSQQMRNVSFSPPFLGWWSRSTRKTSKSLTTTARIAPKSPQAQDTLHTCSNKKYICHCMSHELIQTKNLSLASDSSQVTANISWSCQQSANLGCEV